MRAQLLFGLLAAGALNVGACVVTSERPADSSPPPSPAPPPPAPEPAPEPEPTSDPAVDAGAVEPAPAVDAGPPALPPKKELRNRTKQTDADAGATTDADGGS